MSFPFLSTTASQSPAPAVPWQTYRQQQQQPNQVPAGSLAPLAAELDPLDEGDDEASGTGADSFDAAPPQDSSSASSDNDEPPAAALSSAEPLRAERRRRNQLEKELRKAIKMLIAEEIQDLQRWCYANYSREHEAILNRCFVRV